MKLMAIQDFRKPGVQAGVLAVVCLLAAPVQAMTWTKIGETPEVVLHVNRNAVEKDDAIRRVWEMQDMKIADPDGVRSRRYMNEYDCQYKMHRISQMDSFSGPGLTGTILPGGADEQRIRADEPVLVCLQAWDAASDDDGHWVVVKGYGRGRFVLGDPSEDGDIVLTEEELLDRWHDRDGDGVRYVRFGIVVRSGDAD